MKRNQNRKGIPMAATEHDRLLAGLIDALRLIGATNIRADLNNLHRPAKIVWTRTQEGHIPDASATINGKKVIFEVETCDTLFTDHTESQLKLFGAYSRQKKVPCFIVVPANCEIQAGLQIDKLKVPIHVVGY